MKKIKLFLGAYIDTINAQDINCYNIAKFINKNLFEVHALIFNNDVALPGVMCHKVSNNRVLKNFDKLRIMQTINADLYYLPRVEKIDILFAKFSNKRIVSSVEIQTVYENKLYYKFFNDYISNYFCISDFLNQKNKKYWKKAVDVLYLGVDILHELIERKSIHNIVFIGSMIERKRPRLFLELTKEFPYLQFIMIGDGNLLQSIKTEAAYKKLDNIEFTGKLNNVDVLENLKKYDLLVITSKEEGLPKIVLEAASRGIPTIYINQFYNIDYIKNKVNGFEAENIQDVKKIIYNLLYDEKSYQNVCKKAYETSSKYSWNKLIGDYEKFFLKVLKN